SLFFQRHRAPLGGGLSVGARPLSLNRARAPSFQAMPDAAQRLRTNSVRRTRPLMASNLQSISSGLSVSRIDLISVPCLIVWPAPLTLRSLIRTTESPSASSAPDASRTSMVLAAALRAAISDAGSHSPDTSS